MLLVERVQHAQESSVLRYPLLLISDHAGFVDDVGDPASSVKFLQCAIRICNQRKRDLILPAEFQVGFKAVRADAQDLGMMLFKEVNVPLESLHFAFSDGSKISIIKGEHYWTFQNQIA